MLKQKPGGLIRNVGKVLLWIVWDLSSVRFVYEKIVPPENNRKPYRKPSTIVIWVVTVYVACYGFASQRYEGCLERAEFKYNTFTTQVAANVPFALHRIDKIASMKLPVQPDFWNPFAVWDSICFDMVFQTYAQKEEKETWEKYPNFPPFIKGVVQLWKHKLINADLTAYNDDYMEGTDLNNVNLFEADLRKANLNLVDFTKANLYKADLTGASLTFATFTEAYLNMGDFTKADLTGVNFTKADLTGVNFTKADLTGVNFTKANLYKADLTGAELGSITDIISLLTKSRTLYHAKLLPDIKTAIRVKGYGDLLDKDPKAPRTSFPAKATP